MRPQRIWMRIGGYINPLDKDVVDRILGGDVPTLMECINRDGFDIDGEACIPPDGNMGYNIDDDINFLL